ncbi:hypothetical protein [Leeuwenhoekiella sp. MAR_2009_132]|uniref:hypothetical protein n=1 Tax=unclassified Leeuwenhoekiella TaxID=2615029 RepID=UPI000F6638BC|nr:hypothetical protein [Leeuwenhoekiella sp. MAR_2009_132]MDP5044492.1 hypothetical protein [Leeuwenhoekiella sp.]
MDIHVSSERLGHILNNPSLITMDALELFSFLMGLLYWRKFSGTPVIWFILFLGYNFVNEMISALVYITELVDMNFVFYNIRYFICFTVYYGLYYKFLQKSSFRKATVLLYAIWLLSYLSFILTSDFFSEKPILAAVTGDFFLIIIILFYLVETINNTDFNKIQDFILIYISVALLLSSVVQLPVVIMTYVGWAQITDATNSLNTFFSIVRNASFWAYCVMYIIFAYGFYRAKRPQLVNI